MALINVILDVTTCTGKLPFGDETLAIHFFVTLVMCPTPRDPREINFFTLHQPQRKQKRVRRAQSIDQWNRQKCLEYEGSSPLCA